MVAARSKILFITADRDFPHCSFHELGLDFYNHFLTLSKKFEFVLFDAGSISEPYPSMDINGFRAVIFNYANGILMGFYPKSFFDSITIPKIMVNYEARDNPWANGRCHTGNLHDLFNFMIIPDNCMEIHSETDVLLLPRIVPRRGLKKRAVNTENPIFSSYGLPSPQKDITAQLEAINKEFTQGTYRLHFPPDSRGGHGQSYISIQNGIVHCRNIAKPGIRIEATENFKTDGEIYHWLEESDLNMFFYTPMRDIETLGTFPGSIDRAISVRRPLAVLRQQCTRYVNNYVPPYPEASLREIMAAQTGVEAMYKEGNPSKNIDIMDTWIEERI
jgi:hypothetical protein